MVRAPEGHQFVPRAPQVEGRLERDLNRIRAVALPGADDRLLDPRNLGPPELHEAS